MAGSGPRAHLSVLSRGRKLLCRCGDSEFGILTFSRSDSSGVGTVPGGLILGKALSWGGERRERGLGRLGLRLSKQPG